MTAFTTGIRPVAALQWRAWGGTVADLWQAEGQLGGGGSYLSPDPRLVIFLGAGPAPLALGPEADPSMPRRIAFVPAGMALEGRVARDGGFAHLDLHLEAPVIAARLAARIGAASAEAALARPVLLEAHPGAEALAALIAAEVAQPAHDPLVAESLTLALLGMVLPLSPPPPGRSGGLTPAQEARVTALMQARLGERLRVADLAREAGLSPSWFAHAFRASFGTSPARHLSALRIEEAKRLLAGGTDRLDQIAAATGHADQAHMTRAFRKDTGITPAAWRRMHAG
ncbi:AraC family transcriptional regulator [Pseudoroseicyclus aestuarii]|nr:AraC family transcriptional regulator [Pseudoroseicyclus aestuarii]